MVRDVNAPGLHIDRNRPRRLQTCDLRNRAALRWIEDIYRGGARLGQQQHSVGKRHLAKAGCAGQVDHADLAKIGGARHTRGEQRECDEESGKAHGDPRKVRCGVGMVRLPEWGSVVRRFGAASTTS